MFRAMNVKFTASCQPHVRYAHRRPSQLVLENRIETLDDLRVAHRHTAGKVARRLISPSGIVMYGRPPV